MMIQEFEYIDNYFKGLLSDEEMNIFGQRLIDDPLFAGEVAFYVSAQDVARDLAREEKRNRFRQINVDSGDRKKGIIKKWIPYVAAAVFVGLISLLSIFYFTNPSPQKLARQYIETHFTILGVEMSVSKDSLQQSLDLFNDGQFESALVINEKIIQNDSTNVEAIQNAGIASLRLKYYDKALAYFYRLANIPNLKANPGKFNSAVTLLDRNQPGDLLQAKKLLREVIENNLEGVDTAKNWLKKL